MLCLLFFLLSFQNQIFNLALSFAKILRLAGVVIVVGVIGVIVHRKRKRASGMLWTPEGFQLSNKKQRKDPIGQDDLQLQVIRLYVVAPVSL